jgi:hypothetical protein
MNDFSAKLANQIMSDGLTSNDMCVLAIWLRCTGHDILQEITYFVELR